MQSLALASGALADEAATAFYQWPLPACIWPAIDRLYHSSFCSQPHLRIYGSFDTHTCVWVSRNQGVIDAVVLFNIRHNKVRVINEMIQLPTTHLAAFAQAVFAHYKKTSVIKLHALASEHAALAYPACTGRFSEDYVLALPAAMTDYLAGLSRQMREKIRRCQRRVARQMPALQVRVLREDAIQNAQIEAVINLSRARMAKQGRRFGMDKEDTQKLAAMVSERGLVVLLELHGAVCAGCLCSITGNEVFMHVLAHDPQHDDLRLGLVCCVQAIQSAIDLRCLRFHFLWGYYDYKIRLGGSYQALNNVLIFKNWFAMMRHPHLLAQLCMSSARYTLRQWRSRHKRELHVDRHATSQ